MLSTNLRRLGWSLAHKEDPDSLLVWDDSSPASDGDYVWICDGALRRAQCSPTDARIRV